MGQTDSSGGQLVEELSELLARACQGVGVVTPIAPARSNGLQNRVHERNLRQVLQNLRVFVVLNAVPNRFHADPRSGLRRSDGPWWIQEDAVPRSAQAAAARRGIHIVPAADGVPRRPAVSTVVQ